MGIFDSSTETTSRLALDPAQRQTKNLLDNELNSLIGQDFLSPDELVAEWSPALQAGVNNMIGAGGQQQDMSAALFGTGMEGLQGFGVGQQGLMDVLQQGAVQNQGFNPAQMQQYMPEGQIQGSIQAALRDPYRQLTEQQLPGAGMAAAASGNAGSSRRGMGEAILQRGFDDRAADVSAGIRGQYEGRAFDQLSQQAQQNAQLGAGYQGLQANVGNNLMQSGMMGAGLMGQGNNMLQQGLQNQIGGGQMQTGYEQQLLDANLQGFMFPYQQLPMLSQVGQNQANTYGTQVNTQTQNEGWGNTLIGGGLGLASSALMGGMNPMSMLGGLGGGGGGGMSPVEQMYAGGRTF